MQQRLSGKKALITGAAKGIGLGCARMLAKHGCEVTICDINVAGTESLAQEITGRRAIHLDVTSKRGWVAAIDTAAQAMGGLNILVNNAGIIIPGSVESLSEQDWDQTIDVDLKSVFLGCQTALPVLAKSAPASIINIASISSMIASSNFAAYNAAKAGVQMLTKSVALHAALKHPGIRCNSIHPAFVDTDMVDRVTRAPTRDAAKDKLARQIPLGRIATVEDVAWAVVYLASDEFAFMTGSELKLDGGVSAM